MDFFPPDAIQNIILGVMGNGLTSLIAHSGQKCKAYVFDEKFLQEMQEKSHSLQGLLQNASDSVAEEIEWNGPAKLEEVCLFLMSPEVESIVRQIYSTKLLNSHSSIELIRQEFITAFSLHTGLDQKSVSASAHLLFDALIAGCDYMLNDAIDQGILAAHEAKSSLRHHLLLDELANIKENLTFLTAAQKPDVPAILEFEKKYRQQVEAREGYAKPPYVDTAHKFPIDEIYVSPSFTKRSSKPEAKQTFSLPEFLSTIYRAVLLGNPGGGKSTFTQKVCHDLITHYDKRLFAGRQVTPVRVILREYGAEKKIRNCSILQFIEMTANSDYQIESPVGAFKYLLLNGCVVVIFDGLDELLDTSHRQEISDDVETFCRLYPSVPVIVTSREVGYEQAPLDEKKFDVFRLAPFDDAQVQEYVTKWFATDIDLPADQRNKKVENFLKESRIVPDLRSNPLMLALMCNIYRGENYIPENRPEVYGKCAEMLFERWDKSRGITVQLSIQSKIKPAMMDLAYWIYADESLQGGVTERWLIARATDYLHTKRFEDRDDAEDAAREFIEFCRGRAWVFTDTGTTERGERLYQFTHRTFLEYFTAAHLTRIHSTPEKLGEVLLPRIAKREWDVVAQLAFQLQYTNVEGAGDELLSMLLTKSKDLDKSEGFSLISFAVRCLEFMVPSPRVTKNITIACVELCISTGLDSQDNLSRNFSPESLLSNLLGAADENRAVIANTLEMVLIEKGNNSTEAEALLALDIGLNLTISYRISKQIPSREELEFWESISNAIFAACSDAIDRLSPKSLNLSIGAFWRKKYSVTSLATWHGVQGLFCICYMTMFSSSSWTPIAIALLYQVIRRPTLSPVERSTEDSIDELEKLGQLLLVSSPPWIRKNSSNLVTYLPWLVGDKSFLEEGPTISTNTLFAVYIVLAAMLEVVQQQQESIQRELFGGEVTKYIRENKLPMLQSIRWPLVARFEQIEEDEVQDSMEQCGFTSEQQAFIWRWIRREIDLVRKEVKGKRKFRRRRRLP